MSDKQEQNQQNQQSPVKSLTSRFIQHGTNGSIAAFSAFPYVYPLDIIKKDMQLSHGQSYTQSITSLYQQGGYRRFFKGAHIALLEVVPSRFVSFGIAEISKTLLPQEWDDTEFGKFGKRSLSAFIGAWCKATLFCPVDTIKTRFQTFDRLEHLQEQPNSSFGIARQIWRDQGIRGLYRGYTNLGVKGSLNFIPFFVGMDYADEYISKPERRILRVARDGLIGTGLTVVADMYTYPLDVVKNYRQASIKNTVNYNIISHEGVQESKSLSKGLPSESKSLSKGLPSESTWSILKAIYKEKGILGLYKGYRVRSLAALGGGFIFTAVYLEMRERSESK